MRRLEIPEPQAMDGFMSSTKHHSQLLAGLAVAYAASQPIPLLESKSQPGLFPCTALGKATAQESLSAGWLEVKRTTSKGKTVVQFVSITEAGVRYVLAQNNPRPLLEQLQNQLGQTESRLHELQLSVREAHQTVESIRNKMELLRSNCVEPQVTQSRVAVPNWEEAVTTYLQQRQNARPAEDCPLTELYQQARQTMPEMSVGTFHDGLRKLCSERRIALQPWTGPLHELPEPSLALLQGHSLAFYASALG